MSIAVLGGGCFWCTEAVFKMLKGVVSVMPGYAGGTMVNPSYEQVSSGVSGHAEVIKIEYDPAQVSFNDLLTVFFATHDPTTPNRQGNDVGEQYRSIILTTTPEQHAEAEHFIRELNASSDKGATIVTQVEMLTTFYEAEDYHKNYYARNSGAPYCAIVINPKLEKVQQKFTNLLAESNVESGS